MGASVGLTSHILWGGIFAQGSGNWGSAADADLGMLPRSIRCGLLSSAHSCAHTTFYPSPLYMAAPPCTARVHCGCTVHCGCVHSGFKCCGSPTTLNRPRRLHRLPGRHIHHSRGNILKYQGGGGGGSARPRGGPSADPPSEGLAKQSAGPRPAPPRPRHLLTHQLYSPVNCVHETSLSAPPSAT